MTPPRITDLWALARLLSGHGLNGDLEAVSAPIRGLAAHLGGLPLEERSTALGGYLSARPDGAEIIKAVAAVDPLAPPPEADLGNGRCFATLGDIAQIVSGQEWLWRSWIATGVLNALASEPGTGKSRFGLDLARRLWFKLPWPDGQENDWPEETRTLWIQGDRNFAEMLQAAREFGIPPEAVALGAPPDDPTGCLDLDDAATLESLAERIEAAAPALVVIDTVGMTTSRNLCRPDEAREFFAPILELSGRLGVAFLGLTHLSANKEALGRRIVEKARVVLKMTQPDPEGQPNRRKLWVDKTAVVKPPPLGITMGDAGNDYDSTPPTEPESTSKRPGPPAAKLEECKRWLADRLTPNPGRVTEIREDAESQGFPGGTLYRAKNDLGVEEFVLERRKWWRLPAEPGAQDVQDDPS